MWEPDDLEKMDHTKRFIAGLNLIRGIVDPEEQIKALQKLLQNEHDLVIRLHARLQQMRAEAEMWKGIYEQEKEARYAEDR